MTRVMDCIDPDEWIAEGKNLMNFVIPSDETGVALVYQAATMVKGEEHAARLLRWVARVGELCSPPEAKIKDVLTEEQLRAAWRESASI